ncbi:response regulator [Flavobacterium sp.]|uniref:response regulator n=1 Tax=Flavobacterium sp. TaxID=239 RepID=UPI0039E4F8A8
MKTADLTIFYADDDLEDLEFFTEVTNAIDREITVVTHQCGDELIDALHNPPPSPHIIFLDLNMPGRNGFDVLEELKTSEHLKEIPVVVFSTSNDEKNIAKSRELGANYYLPKLGSYESFKKSIEDTLNINWNTFEPTAHNFLYSA